MNGPEFTVGDVAALAFIAATALFNWFLMFRMERRLSTRLDGLASHLSKMQRQLDAVVPGGEGRPTEERAPEKLRRVQAAYEQWQRQGRSSLSRPAPVGGRREDT